MGVKWQKSHLSQSAAAGDKKTDAAGKVQRQPLFADENVNTFFRRLAWSPDGAPQTTLVLTHAARAMCGVHLSNATMQRQKGCTSQM